MLSYRHDLLQLPWGLENEDPSAGESSRTLGAAGTTIAPSRKIININWPLKADSVTL